MRVSWLLISLLAASAISSAATSEEMVARTQPQIDALVNCSLDEAVSHVASKDTSASIAEAEVASCKKELDALEAAISRVYADVNGEVWSPRYIAEVSAKNAASYRAMVVASAIKILDERRAPDSTSN